ncbi:MAG: aspartate aminotransferase family protein [Alphaproteobacteria bacterium]|nr:MAG: aspartate aminotransferase family protein [Alphaproteobacteria bacterium]
MRNYDKVTVAQHFISGEGAGPFLRVSHGEGVYLWGQDGIRYLDGSSGAVVTSIGHANPRVLDAMAAQASRVTFAYARIWENDVNEQLAQRLAENAGGGLDASFFVSGGSEATEACIKFARQVALARGQGDRWKVISRMPSYHGNTLGALAITGDPVLHSIFGSMLKDMPKITAPLSYRLPSGVSEYEHAMACAAELEQRIIEEGPETVLAFILEPIGGTATGAAYAPDAYYSKVREICNRYDILLIFDEVMSGIGRSGRFLAAHYWPDCVPDIVGLSKGLAAGYSPLGGMLTRKDLVNEVRASGGFAHGHTYVANPISCSAAVAVIDELVENDLIPKSEKMGALLKERLGQLKGEVQILGDVRGRGMMMAIEIVANQETKEMLPDNVGAVSRIQKYCAEEGLLLLSRKTAGGAYGEWLMVCPPLIITLEQVDELMHSLRTALLRLQDELVVEGII